MAEFSYGAVLDVTPEEAFAFVSDPGRWPLFVGHLRSAEKADGWGQAGGRARVVTSAFGRQAVVELEITRWEAPRALSLTARYPGRADLQAALLLEPEVARTTVSATTTVALRSGAWGVVDRLRALSTKRRCQRAMLRLAEVIPHAGVGPAARI